MWTQLSGPSNLRAADELTFADLERLDRDRTLCVCAVSALEVHGPHLPIGADFHQACWMADETGRRFAERHPDWTVLRYPPLPIGTDELALAGSINTPPHTVYLVVRAYCEQLMGAGFRYVMLTNAHGGPRHAAALEAAAIRVSKKHGACVIAPSIRALHRLVSGEAREEVEAYLGRRLTADEASGTVSGEHAGTWETAWYLSQRPELVSPGYRELDQDDPPAWAPLAALARGLRRRRERRSAPEGEAAAKNRLALDDVFESLAGGIGWLLNSRSGYGAHGRRVSYKGRPQIASKELGDAYAELPVRMCLEDLEAVVAGTLDPTDVRSIASDAWLIQPGSLRALGAGAIAIAILALAFWLNG